MAWKDFAKNLKYQVSEFLEIPGEVVLDLPRIVVLGNLRLVVENHRGILKYGPELVHLNMPEGELVVRGRDLRLRSVFPEEICIEGHIESIVFG